jgi:hypothetical protein
MIEIFREVNPERICGPPRIDLRNGKLQTWQGILPISQVQCQAPAFHFESSRRKFRIKNLGDRDWNSANSTAPIILQWKCRMLVSGPKEGQIFLLSYVLNSGPLSRSPRNYTHPYRPKTFRIKSFVFKINPKLRQLSLDAVAVKVFWQLLSAEWLQVCTMKDIKLNFRYWASSSSLRRIWGCDSGGH